ncbi:MAG: hypothetical protein KIG51_03265, partial [Fibrobacter sp.]|nr:hypothetical protein [Fibrobacter sp.]
AEHRALIHINKAFRSHMTHSRRRRIFFWHIQQLRHRESGQNEKKGKNTKEQEGGTFLNRGKIVPKNTKKRSRKASVFRIRLE